MTRRGRPALLAAAFAIVAGAAAGAAATSTSADPGGLPAALGLGKTSIECPSDPSELTSSFLAARGLPDPDVPAGMSSVARATAIVCHFEGDALIGIEVHFEDRAAAERADAPFATLLLLASERHRHEFLDLLPQAVYDGATGTRAAVESSQAFDLGPSARFVVPEQMHAPIAVLERAASGAAASTTLSAEVGA